MLVAEVHIVHKYIVTVSVRILCASLKWDALVQVLCRLPADYILVDVPDLSEERFPVTFIRVV
jgi:hypothetical protein